MKRLVLMVALLGSASTMADNTAVIQGSGNQYEGVLSINQAAGNQQQMSNSRAIVLGGQATNLNIQKLDGNVDPSLNAKAAILGTSFSNGNGVLGINQSAGANNQSINAVRISLNPGPQSIDDSVLLQQNTTQLTDSGLTPTTGSRQVVTSDQAFTGSRGVIQVNQSAGVGNRVANTLGITIK
ncbi:Fap amyloid fibril minor component [Pseudomonas sp. R2-37-08W]|uniref:adhesin n=1 Tax=unclassified Pseudomonas TaxID=196821 RepID=UPI000F57407A|nr:MULTISPECIES: adhesin [unclassified Pseudomonas]AZF10481.1 Fap amyloid fibril minor component [Pseudomonas sp. R2-37-08W]AZF21032.1 Fap amyloid fibril minor component [Pseudomonas sp. R3-52-08]AZF26373.1 Fap amyloid fibril minor component [Pseudomonas sp. R2-60-08W]AZF31725.1 Fap amyloid fibril minor component [Pseudomonas sp. R4-35-07]AZF37006.1 Fap amyloid fibril minor component [Pseudomonas sp. R4-39-08]